MSHIFKSSVFIIIIAGFFILCLALRPPGFIKSERRPPASFPEIDMDDISSGDFMEDFERAATDNFPFRESFRTLRAVTVLGAFMQKDKNGLYMDDHGVGEIIPVDEESVKQVTEKLNGIAGELTGMNIYYSFIPDKSYYSEKKLPGFDAEIVRNLFTPTGQFIDITDTLSAESFYKTDLHWDQTKLGSTAKTLLDVMDTTVFGESFAQDAAGFSPDILPGNYSKARAGNFKGVYSGQIALPIGEESMYYLENFNLEAWYLNAQATGFEKGPVYDTGKFTGVDPYDFFLRGAQPLVTIKNKAPLIDRELFIFRDSFSSSLAPLLAGAYRQVTLIDLRYINMTTLRGLTDFTTGSDVLFLYSSQILNRAEVLL